MNFHPLLHCEFPAENWIGGKKFYLIFRAFGLLIKIQRVKKKRTMKNHRHIQNRSRTRSRENKNPSPRATAEVKKKPNPLFESRVPPLTSESLPKKKKTPPALYTTVQLAYQIYTRSSGGLSVSRRAHSFGKRSSFPARFLCCARNIQMRARAIDFILSRIYVTRITYSARIAVDAK